MSIEFEATLFDGKSSKGTRARVSAQAPDAIRIHSGDSVSLVRLCELSVSSRLGNSARYLTLPDGGKLQTADNDGVDRLLRSLAADRRSGLIHALEARWEWVALAVLVTGIFLWWSVAIGLPLLADHTARAIPISLEQSMGTQSLSALDRRLLAPTRLPEVQRERARRVFAQAMERRDVESDLDIPPSLELRRSDDLGANAFALPSGIVVLTDELVMLEETDEELLSVIAHELGHVHHRHIMRSLLQNSAVALVVATVLGDVSSITGLAASLPTLLVQQGYSREFEFEADRYAARALNELGIGTQPLTSALRKLGTAHKVPGAVMGDYLSTHPGIERRIEAVENMAP